MFNFAILVRPALVLSLLVTGAASRADEMVSFAPAGSWSVDFADDSCTAERSFQNGSDTVLLRFRSYGPADSIQVLVASNSLAVRPGSPATAFVPDQGEPESHRGFQTIAVDDWKGAQFRQSLNLSDEKAVSAYFVKDLFSQDVRLTTGPLDQILKVMRDCEDDLLSSLGLDASANRTLSQPLEITGEE